MNDELRGYCIGKATRYKEDELVLYPPYVELEPETLYDVLRTAIYPSWRYARLAGDLAREFNPVGFVVLRVKKEDITIDDR